MNNEKENHTYFKKFGIAYVRMNDLAVLEIFGFAVFLKMGNRYRILGFQFDI